MTLLKMQHSNVISEHIKLNTRKSFGGQIFPPSNLDSEKNCSLDQDVLRQIDLVTIQKIPN